MISLSQGILGVVLLITFLVFAISLATNKTKGIVITSIIMGAYVFGNFYLLIFQTYPY